ncbi:MAG: hypothetical protein ACPGJS_17990 [Flammeovirgaceae bacterium]
MRKELIISTEDTLSGAPRLDGRRLDVAHLITGITEFDNGNMQSYQDDFEVTTNQIRHAIMYCMDEICELKEVPVACNGCSKKFEKDIKTWGEFVQEMGGIEQIQTEDDSIIKLGESSILMGDLEDFKAEFEGRNIWEIAKRLYHNLKEALSLPNSYEQLINED